MPGEFAIRSAAAYQHGRVAYVAALVVLVISAVVGLIGIQRDSTNNAAADGISSTDSTPHSTPHSSPSTGTTTPTPLTHRARVTDRRGDTTGPDLLGVSARANEDVLRVAVTLGMPLADDVVIRIFIDADSDRRTGSLSFPCPAATLGADYEIATQGDHTGQFMASVADGCARPFRAATSTGLTIDGAGDRLDVGIPTGAIRRPGEHVIGLYVQALRTTGGQIDSCPGQHNRPLSVRY